MKCEFKKYTHEINVNKKSTLLNVTVNMLHKKHIKLPANFPISWEVWFGFQAAINQRIYGWLISNFPNFPNSLEDAKLLTFDLIVNKSMGIGKLGKLGKFDLLIIKKYNKTTLWQENQTSR